MHAAQFSLRMQMLGATHLPNKQMNCLRKLFTQMQGVLVIQIPPHTPGTCFAPVRQ